jgi:hypothetical protein
MSEEKEMSCEEQDEIKLYGKAIYLLYDCDIDESYELVSKNTNYLDNIKRNEIKDIRYSYYKETIILLKDGTILIDGKIHRINISRIWFQNGLMIYGITFNNEIVLLTGYESQLCKYINNDNCKYKKIVTTALCLAALTTNGQVRIITPILNSGVIIDRLINVDDIEVIVNETDESDEVIIVKQKDKYWPILVEDK